MKKHLFLLLLFWAGLVATSFAQSTAPITVREVDGNPSVTGVTQMIFPNGSVSRSGSRVTISLTGGGSLASPAGNGIVVHTGAGSTVNRTLTAGAGISVSNGTGVSGNPTVTWDGSTFVNNITLWDSANASRTLTAGLSGATDPVITFANAQIEFSTQIVIGVGSVTAGKISLYNATNGFITTVQPGVPAGDIALTLPATADTLAGVAATQTFTNKTLTASSNTLGGVTMTLGSDADGDIYYRASNVLARLPKGTALQQLRMNAGATAPEWGAVSGVSLTNDAAQSINHATLTGLTFNTETYDTDGYHSTESNTSRITAPVTGKYLLTASVQFASHNTGYRYAVLRRNGATDEVANRKMTVQNAETEINLSHVVSAAASDYFEIFVYQTAGTAINVTASLLHFTCTRLN